MKHILFAGNLGRIGQLLGIDYAPVSLEGGRATISQGQQWVEDDGRVQSFAPSLR